MIDIHHRQVQEVSFDGGSLWSTHTSIGLGWEAWGVGWAYVRPSHVEGPAGEVTRVRDFGMLIKVALLTIGFLIPITRRIK